jgi:hypothetical protein
LLQGLRDIMDFLARDAASPYPAFDVRWYLSPQLSRKLSMDPGECGADQKWTEALRNADALVAPPHSVVIEGMLTGIPVAVLDYGHSLRHFMSAWRITAETHIAPVMRALSDPPPAQQSFQEYLLHDLCACHSPAAPRLAYLVERMIAIGQSARHDGHPLRFPLQIVPQDASEIALGDQPLGKGHAYPDHARFKREHAAARAHEVRLLRSLVGSRQSSLNRLDSGLRGWDADLKARSESLDQRESSLSQWESVARQYLGPSWDCDGAVIHFLSWVAAAQEKERPIYCWGAGELGRRFIFGLNEMAGRIGGFIDNDPAKKGIAWGKPVYGPALLWESNPHNRPFIFITSVWASEIASSLDAKGFLQGQDYVSVPLLGPKAFGDPGTEAQTRRRYAGGAADQTAGFGDMVAD